MFDDGWKDTSIGVVHLTTAELEQANKTGTPLPIKEKKSGKIGGELLVRTFSKDIVAVVSGGGWMVPGGENVTPKVYSGSEGGLSAITKLANTVDEQIAERVGIGAGGSLI